MKSDVKLDDPEIEGKELGVEMDSTRIESGGRCAWSEGEQIGQAVWSGQIRLQANGGFQPLRETPHLESSEMQRLTRSDRIRTVLFQQAHRSRLSWPFRASLRERERTLSRVCVWERAVGDCSDP